jgi:hypothetical protein
VESLRVAYMRQDQLVDHDVARKPVPSFGIMV